jgi:hypothetical protein
LSQIEVDRRGWKEESNRDREERKEEREKVDRGQNR